MARRKLILRLMIRVPLLRIRGCVLSCMVLWMVVGSVGIVVYRGMSLGRYMVVVVLPSALVHRHGRRDMRARHHGQRSRAMLPSQSAPVGDQATKLRGN